MFCESRCKGFCTAAPSRFLHTISSMYALLMRRKLGHAGRFVERSMAEVEHRLRAELGGGLCEAPMLRS